MKETYLNKTFALNAISPIDGRYSEKTMPLRNWFSEYSLIYHRIKIEIYWLIALSEAGFPEISKFSNDSRKTLLQLIEKFNISDAKNIKKIEKIINHDVKAIEYWIKKSIKNNNELKLISEFIHFGCTSEDINSSAYGMMLSGASKNIIIPALSLIKKKLIEISHKYSEHPVLSRTHGQPASTTTIGKEISNVAFRLKKIILKIENIKIFAKISGAVGNFNAHLVAYPNFNWILFVSKFIEKKLKLNFNHYTTQIEPHDYMAELFNTISSANTILIDFNRDMWGYISLGYFKQKINIKEVGSSTMPHKINPINFENSEGNLGIANALLHHFASKLPISRWQRDLTDSTVLRNIGVAFGHCLLAYDSLITGIKKIEINLIKINKDLDNCWEILTEPIQIIMRKHGIKKSFERLQKMSRNKIITKHVLHKFINQLNIPKNDKITLLKLTPASYIGNASFLAKNIL